MDPEEIVKLCEQLNLDDQDGLVMNMNSEVIQDRKEKMELCLVGRVFGNKIANRDGLGDLAEQIWRTSRKVKVESMGVINFFMFHFGCKYDRQRVLSGGPWSFNNQLILFLRPQGAGLVSSMDFTKVPFWIQFHNVPIVCRSEKCARVWGELIGRVLEADAEGPTLRARVVVNVNLPLCRGLRVFVDDNMGSVSIPIQYEYLLEFCFRCGGGGDSDGGYEAMQILRENNRVIHHKTEINDGSENSIDANRKLKLCLNDEINDGSNVSLNVSAGGNQNYNSEPSPGDTIGKKTKADQLAGCSQVNGKNALVTMAVETQRDSADDGETRLDLDIQFQLTI
ncbi:hypothetical protein TorRG33x02_146460 [Trema orientale]|uniref:DUF4283 domain-containing protein n=1 Tax=Trema orientale TaxID=63057 RepID=A0A2P5EVE8_TREOI|nr:hypothetical protein TorRG33x02_146460 [Trema orientale]